MSIAEEIANLTAKFTEQKTQEVIANMTLNEVAQVWSDVRTSHDAAATTPEQKAEQDKDFAERKDVLQKIITPESLQSKMNEYLEGLANGTYSPADFSKISEFCSDFNDEFKNDAIKNSLDELKKRMNDKRLEVEKEVTIIPDETLSKNLNIEGLDSIVIEGNPERIAFSTDKNSVKGKTVTFKDSEGEDLAGVEFVDGSNASMLLRDENGMAVEYSISGSKLSKIENGSEIKLDPANLNNEQDRQALKYASSAQKIWKSYARGELDNSVEKEVLIGEGKPATKINENQNKTTIDQKKEATKIDDGNEETEKTATRFNEEQSGDKNEADLNGDTSNDKPTAEDELYWKEQDIIEAMFKDWFLAAANSVTNWVVHQIEYSAAGIWNEFEKSYIERKAERKKEIENAKKKDATQEFYGKIEDVSDKHMTKLCSSYRGTDNGQTSNQQMVAAIREGKIDEALANSPLLNSLRDFKINPKDLLTQGNPETTVPFVAGMATMAAKFADVYAKASILNARMNDKDAFKGRDPSELYEAKRKEALLVLQHQMIKEKEKDPNSNPSETMFKSIKQCNEDMAKALKTAIKDYDNGQYIDKGKNPHKNEILERYESLAHPAQTMQEEMARQQQAENNINNQREAVANEEAANTSRTEDVAARRQRLETYRQQASLNPGMSVRPRNNPEVIRNLDPSMLRYIHGQNNTK